jgi:hypothetical protein
LRCAAGSFWICSFASSRIVVMNPGMYGTDQERHRTWNGGAENLPLSVS